MDGGHGWLRRGAVSVAVLLGLGALAIAGQTPVSSVAVDTPLGDRPVTARFANIAAASAGTAAVLSIENLKGRSTQPVRINVFVDKPEADRRTPATDPHWAGVIQLMPRQGEVHSLGTLVDLAGFMNPGSGRPIAITLVPVVGTDSSPQGLELTLGRMSIRYEPQ
ncbi:protein of unknown function [Beijerinckiaceae bacterium RH AL1]|nr:protein of unknown function [Beijerinckiaceae bacterium RH CH11]VVB47738.1 protein of unknown function [Beijerinckiaceae bacterium RH AL8]VVC55999.1 protein of unknown function [Beijerinckiaceae bacterium RH AL1]